MVDGTPPRGSEDMRTGAVMAILVAGLSSAFIENTVLKLFGIGTLNGGKANDEAVEVEAKETS